MSLIEKVVNQKELNKIVEANSLWFKREEGGERADLSYADLRDADLSYADLRSANLSSANLRSANLRSADLSYAKGFLYLPIQDMRGYSFAHAVDCEGTWRIRVGCRDFTIDEAKAHWGEGYLGDRERGDMYLYAVEWLEKKLEKMA